MTFNGKPSANQLILWNGTSFVSSYITDANIDAYATISGSKINPNFGSQTISTTGALTATSATLSSLTTGIAHLGVSGAITSSLVVNADVSATAAIAGSKITPNFGMQSVISGVSVVAPTLAFSSVGGSKITSGSGIPSTTASSGSLYVRTDGYVETSLYSYNFGSWGAIGGIKISPVITANYTITSADQFLPIDTSAGAFTITLPSAPVSGQRFTINDVAGSLSTNNCTLSSSITILSPVSGPTNTIVLNQNGFSGSFIYNGSTWSICSLLPSSSGGGGGSPTGSAGGDLSGTYPNPTVNKIQGVGLSNTAPSANQFLVATSSTNWQPATLSKDLSTAGQGAGQVLVVGIQGYGVAAPTTTGTVLTWNGTGLSWSAPAGGAPSGTAGGDLSGSYPNPTVSKIRGLAVPAPSVSGTYLEYTSSGLAWNTPTGGGGGSTTSSGKASSRPTATGSGNTYICTDIPVVYFDNPSTTSWKQFAGEYLPAGPPVSSYTVVGSLGLTQYADSIKAITTTNSTNGYYALTQTNIGSAGYPSSLSATTPWMVTLVASYQPSVNVSYPEIGLCVSNGITSGSSTAYSVSIASDGSSSPYLNATSETVNGARVSNFYQINAIAPWIWGTGRLHYRLLNDGNIIHYQISSEGFNWIDFYSMASPSGMAYYGFWMGLDISGSAFGQALINSNILSSPAQYSVTAATGSGVPVVLTIGTHSIDIGDIVSINGMTGNTAANTTSGAGSLAAGNIVTAITSTTITIGNIIGNGTWVSGGTITNISK